MFHSKLNINHYADSFRLELSDIFVLLVLLCCRDFLLKTRADYVHETYCEILFNSFLITVLKSTMTSMKILL